MSNEHNTGINFTILDKGEVLIGELREGKDWFFAIGPDDAGPIQIHRHQLMKVNVEDTIWMGERALALNEIRQDIESKWLTWRTAIELEYGVTFGKFDCEDGQHEDYPEDNPFKFLFGDRQ